MNNIRGFSSTLVPAAQLSASESKGQESAAPGKQPNAFGDMLAGLSQTRQGEQQQTPTGGAKSNAWKTLSNEPFPDGGKGSNPRSSFDAASASLNEAAIDEKSLPIAESSQNSAQLRLPAGISAPSDFGARAQMPSSLGRTIGNAASSLISRQSSVDDVPDLSAAISASARPANKTLNNQKVPSGVPGKNGAPVSSAQAFAKTPARAQAPVSAVKPLQAAPTSAQTSQTAQADSLTSAVVSDVSRHANQSGTPPSPANTDRRRRTESDSAQTPTTPTADAQLASAAMAMAHMPAPAAAAPATASGAGSETSTSRAHGLPGVTVDPAKALLSALDTDSDGDAPEELGAPIKLDSVSQTTHFTPVAWLSPTQQIANAVGSALSSQSTPDAEGPAPAPVATSATLNSLTATARSSSVSLKTLDLQLDPQDLGAVSIKLNLSSTGLTIEVQASQTGTADLLEKDKRALTEGLSGAGYTVSGVEISFAPANGSATGFTDQGLAQHSSGQSFSGDSQGSGGSQSRDGANDSFSRRNPNQNGHGSQETARSSAQRFAGSGLYI